MSVTLQEPAPPDYHELTRDLDRTKSAAFLGKNAAFLGSLLCSMEFHWDPKVSTAETDGVGLWWNPKFYLGLHVKVRETVLLHELWHPGLLHMIRQGTRDHERWNRACDYKINIDLQDAGYSFEGVESWVCLDPKYRGWVEEDIYDDLTSNPRPPPSNWKPDLRPGTPHSNVQTVNNVVRAIQQHKLGKGAGNLPGGIEDVVTKFLTPVVPWESLFHRFMTELVEESFSWRRPNRRFTDMYMPSTWQDEGALAHLMYVEDVSGSITDADVIRFNSEVKYVKDTFQPKLLTLVQFDTVITNEKTFEADDPFERIEIVGRGGTDLVCVREHIIKHRPTAVVIFSDLECEPMEPLPFNVPIIWVCIRNHSAQVPFGQLIHIR